MLIKYLFIPYSMCFHIQWVLVDNSQKVLLFGYERPLCYLVYINLVPIKVGKKG